MRLVILILLCSVLLPVPVFAGLETGTGVRPLHHVQQHREEVQGGPQHHKQVKDRVHPLFPAADAVEDGADGIGDAPQQHQPEAGLCQCV